VIEQLTYLLFIRRLDDLHTLEENKSRDKKPMQRRVFSGGQGLTRPRLRRPALVALQALRPADMYTVIGEHVFPFLRPISPATWAAEDPPTRTTRRTRGFTIPTTGALAKVVDCLRPRAHGGPRHEG